MSDTSKSLRQSTLQWVWKLTGGGCTAAVLVWGLNQFWGFAGTQWEQRAAVQDSHTEMLRNQGIRADLQRDRIDRTEQSLKEYNITNKDLAKTVEDLRVAAAAMQRTQQADEAQWRLLNTFNGKIALLEVKTDVREQMEEHLLNELVELRSVLMLRSYLQEDQSRSLGEVLVPLEMSGDPEEAPGTPPSPPPAPPEALSVVKKRVHQVEEANKKDWEGYRSQQMQMNVQEANR